MHDRAALRRKGGADERGPGPHTLDERIELGGDGAAERRVDLLEDGVIDEAEACSGGRGQASHRRRCLGGGERASLDVESCGVHLRAGERRRHEDADRPLSGKEGTGVAGTGQVIGDDRDGHGCPCKLSQRAGGMRAAPAHVYSMRNVSSLAHRSGFLVCAVLPATAAVDPANELDLIKPNRQQQAKDFKVASLDGSGLRLADLKGKVVFLNLWATWCPPCKEEMPAMERLWQRYKDQGLVVIALSMDSGEPRRSSRTSSSPSTPIRSGSTRRWRWRSSTARAPSPRRSSSTGAVRSGPLPLGPRDWDGKAAFAYIEALLKDGKPRG